MIKFDGRLKRIAFDLGGIVFDLDAWGVEGLSKIALQILFVLFSFPSWGTSPGVSVCSPVLTSLMLAFKEGCH